LRDSHANAGQLASQIAELEANSQQFDAHVEQSFQILLGLIQDDPTYLSDVDNALKSNTLDSDINRAAYSQLRGIVI
jgi:hypothetical protein